MNKNMIIIAIIASIGVGAAVSKWNMKKTVSPQARQKFDEINKRMKIKNQPSKVGANHEPSKTISK
jgi:hypothetical protein